MGTLLVLSRSASGLGGVFQPGGKGNKLGTPGDTKVNSNNTKIYISNLSKKLKNDKKKTLRTEVCPSGYK